MVVVVVVGGTVVVVVGGAVFGVVGGVVGAGAVVVVAAAFTATAVVGEFVVMTAPQAAARTMTAPSRADSRTFMAST